jgi:hypothetical protein
VVVATVIHSGFNGSTSLECVLIVLLKTLVVCVYSVWFYYFVYCDDIITVDTSVTFVVVATGDSQWFQRFNLY